jgi:hypothetical protein
MDDENEEDESKRLQESQIVEIGFGGSMTMRESFHNTSDIFIARTSMSRDQMRTPSVVESSGGMQILTNYDTNGTPRENLQLLLQSMTSRENSQR